MEERNIGDNWIKGSRERRQEYEPTLSGVRENTRKSEKIVSCPPLKIPNANLLLSKRTQTHVLLINNLIHKLKLGNYLN